MSKLKPYRVGENDIVAAHSKGEAAQILKDYCGTELEDDCGCYITVGD